MPYRTYGSAFRRGQGGINRPAFSHDLTGNWLPALADVHERLGRPGARIANVGCGQGFSTIALARAYPQAEVIGLDADPASILEALHDLARPMDALLAARKALAMCGWSISPACRASVPRSRPPRSGRCFGAEHLQAQAAQAAEAGFARTDVIDTDAGFFRVYRLSTDA